MEPIVSGETMLLPVLPNDNRNNFNYRNQILVVFAVSLGPFGAGLSKGYMSPALGDMQNPIYCGGLGISDQQASWIASLCLLGAFFGGILGGMGMRLGRRNVLMATALPFTLSWLATALSTSVPMISAASFCGGMLISCIKMTTQVYVTEIAAQEIRGRLNSVTVIMDHLGILTSVTLGAYLSWNKLALVVASAPVIFLIAQFFIPETPSSLLRRNREQEAEESLQWLRGPEVNIQEELDQIKSNILDSKVYSESHVFLKCSSFPGLGKKSDIEYRLLSESENIQFTFPERHGTPQSGYVITKYNNTKHAKIRRLGGALIITCGLMFFYRFTGADLFTFYAIIIYQKSFWSLDSHAAAIATSVVQLVASCVSGLLIDKVGRRPLLLISGAMMSVALASFGTYSYYRCILSVSGPYDWIPLTCIFTLTTAVSLGIRPVSSLLLGELLPFENRDTGSGIVTSFSYFCGFVNIKSAVDIQDRIGLHGLFWIYTGMSVLYIIFVLLFVFETRGIEIDELDQKYVESLYNSLDDSIQTEVWYFSN